MRQSVFSGKQLHILLHAVVWLLILLVPVLILYTYGDGNFRHLGHFYTNTLTYGIIFYINYLLLIPRFYFNDKKAAYFLSAILLIALMYLLFSQIDAWVFEKITRAADLAASSGTPGEKRMGPRPPFRLIWTVNFLFMSVLVTGFSFGSRVLGKLDENEKLRKELEKEKLHSELAFLKNQVSPHFFFNTLNNIYALIGMDQDAAQQSVLNLSKLMRYLLYESENGKTTLLGEIGFMKNYIDLMKLRLSPRVKLHIAFPEEFTDFEFPPLLFIPFIENAFKHSISFRGNSFIDIGMEVKNGTIGFLCRNSIGESSQPGDGQHAGIGLDNVRKRLTLLFPGQHNLEIRETPGEFLVNLSITT